MFTTAHLRKPLWNIHLKQHYVGAGATFTTVVASYNVYRYQHSLIINNNESDIGTGILVLFVLHHRLEVSNISSVMIGSNYCNITLF